MILRDMALSSINMSQYGAMCDMEPFQIIVHFLLSCLRTKSPRYVLKSQISSSSHPHECLTCTETTVSKKNMEEINLSKRH